MARNIVSKFIASFNVLRYISLAGRLNPKQTSPPSATLFDRPLTPFHDHSRLVFDLTRENKVIDYFINLVSV